MWHNHEGDYDGMLPSATDISVNPYFAQDGYWDNDINWIEGDCHLKSGAGRWTESGWVIDDANSPCIDAGDPADDVGDESQPNGGRINIGAYGGTEQASKSSGIFVTYPGIPRSLSVNAGHKQLTLVWQDPNDYELCHCELSEV